MTRDQRILEEAAKLFYERGYQGVGVDEIGVRAGVTGPAIYRHFDGKAEILATLFDESLDRCVEVTSGSFDDPFEELEHRARGHAAYVIGDRLLASVWIREIRSLTGRHLRRHRKRELRYVKGWTDCVARCYPHLSDQEITSATWATLGTLNAVALWPPRILDEADVDQLAGMVASFALAGLRGVAEEKQSVPTR